MSDIYLSLTETPSVVTLSQPVVSGVLSSNVTVTNVVSVNVVTMPAITVQAAAPTVTTVAGTVTVSNLGLVPSSVATDGTADGTLNFVKIGGHQSGSNQTAHIVHVSAGGAMSVDATDSVVSISNFPSTQTIAGTVTANLSSANLNSVTIGVRGSVTLGAGTSQIGSVTVGNTTGLTDAVVAGFGSIFGNSDTFKVDIRTPDGSVLDGEASVPVQGTVDIGSLPAISGTVTAIIGNTVTVGTYNATYQTGSVLAAGSNISIIGGYRTDDSSAFPISVTSQGRIRVFDIQNSVTIGSVPNGSLTTRFGTPTTANTAFATSCVTNANRKYLLIQNVTTGSNVITVGIGFTPTTTQGIQLTAGAGITFESSYIPTGQIFVLSSVTASNFTILEA